MRIEFSNAESLSIRIDTFAMLRLQQRALGSELVAYDVRHLVSVR